MPSGTIAMEFALAATREKERLSLLQAPHLRTCVELLSRAGRIVESEIRGSSMGDTIPDGCRIQIRCSVEKRYRPGQIVACVEHGFLFAHRVVHLWGDAVITQGDAWILCDPPFPISQVVGEVISYCVQGSWRPAAAEAVRSPSAANAARRQVRIIAACLAIDLRLARFVARQIISLYMLRKYWRQRFTFTASSRASGQRR